MDFAFVLVILLFGVIVSYIWLISRAFSDGRRIQDLNVRLDRLNDALERLRKTAFEWPPTRSNIKAAPVEPKPAPTPTPVPAPVPEEIPVPIPEPAWSFDSVTAKIVVHEPVVRSDVEIPPILSAPQVVKTEIADFPEVQPLPAPDSFSTPEPTPVREKGSFEMRLGTYWLVRIGAVMLLTGLVFFGNLAYHNLIGKLGPGGKLSFLYLASALLLAAGAWWQRKAAKEALKNYGQVIFAIGLAAVYFTTYAAHHFPVLCVITSPVLDGALLLAWAGFIVWIADRKKSEVLALFAVVLAYYSSVITTVGAFTLYSNLLLTLIAVIFLVRHRWAALTFASLLATYAGYAFWRFFHDGQWHWASPDEGLWFGIYFLAGYWLMFTAAVFLSKNEKLAGQNRSAFLTFNNGAFFSLFLLTMLQVHHGGFWKFALGYGTVLLALAGLSKKLLPEEPLAKNSYLTQGLLLVTVGFISKYAGLQLALVLGAESVVLFILGTQRNSLILKLFAFASALMATGWACFNFEHFDPRGIWLGSGLGAMLVVNAFWAHRQEKENTRPLRPIPAFFSLLALVVWGTATWFNTHEDIQPLAFAIEAALLTFSIYLLRVREITLLAQLFLAMANGAWVAHYCANGAPVPWGNPLIMLAITLGLSHWWQKQKIVVDELHIGLMCQAVYALAIVSVGYVWLQPLTSAPDWLALTSLLAVAVTAYGVFTRAWPLAVCGQLFLAVSLMQFVGQVAHDKPLWYFPLAPIAAMGLLSFATVRWFALKPDSKSSVREPLLKIALVYRWMALMLSLCWVQQYIPERERVWVFMAIGAAVFAFAGWRRNLEAAAFGAAYSVAALANFWILPADRMVYLPNLLALLALLGQQQCARRLPARFALKEEFQGATVVIAGLTLWRFVSCWVAQTQGGFYLTASWSAFALLFFAAGIVLGERIYRWTGLGILAAALGRVVLFDVWKQETIYRVLTFMALGVVLLALGFLYNKYQDKIRRWL